MNPLTHFPNIPSVELEGRRYYVKCSLASAQRLTAMGYDPGAPPDRQATPVKYALFVAAAFAAAAYVLVDDKLAFAQLSGEDSADMITPANISEVNEAVRVAVAISKGEEPDPTDVTIPPFNPQDTSKPN